ncbi:Membrane-spanning 4-domains subfamily A member 4A [Anabarilius grahami]|uniref:Membrane-spanning 4-domains subfamily A member 4A n=1 Tax=Anabarilius grahami TaxID=495550 RepID=A0A3N0Y5M0_ANAGA|nr:Membrane-spanning 4-domains subfamily A member 4A [Anabarilius grahami]
MASSMTTEANGVRVVTHVIPLEEKMESPEASLVKQEKSNLPPKTRMFLKGKPLSLGLVQVFTGLVIMTLCTVSLLVGMLHADFVVFLGLPIKATLAMNVICVLLAAAGTGYFSWELSIRPGEDPCNGGNYWSCSNMFRRFNNLMDGVRGLLLVLSFLQLCMCISLSIFSGRAIVQDETDADPYGSNCSLLKVGLDCPSNP